MPTADELISAARVVDLIACLDSAAPCCDLAQLGVVATGLEGLGFGERVAAIRDALLADLPPGYEAFAETMRSALENPAFSGWMIWPVADAVAVRTLEAPTAARFDDGLALLARLTPRLTAEAALRRFLRHDLAGTLAVAQTWTADPGEHVRRLASEGTRPRLPWATRVPQLLAQPDATIAILDALRDDPSEYVRRSVANHLNDISRADPSLATATAARWLAAPGAQTPRVVRHALRTLVKQGDRDALALLGFAAPGDLHVDGPRIAEATVAIGGELAFDVTIHNRDAEPARLAIDYVIHYRKANGTLAPKVFKLTTRTLSAGERVALTRRQSFRPISTRRHHAGEHALEIQINGRRSGRASFTVVAP